MGNNTNHGHFFKVGVAVTLEFCALVRTPPDASNYEPLLLLMMEGKSRADVATLRRRDVVTSLRYCLLIVVLVDPTSRRWDVTTWGRHDVGTSRRGDVATLERHDVPATFILCFPLLQIASKVCSFQLICTCIHQISHTQISSCQNT